MSETKFAKKILENAHKLAFYMQQYPDKRLPEVSTQMAMPAIDINAAMWCAEDMGYIAPVNKGTGELRFLAEPADGWEFGQGVSDLKASLMYCMAVLARREADLEEFFIARWTAGYPAFDIIVAVKSLLVNGHLVEYELQDQRVDEKGNKMFEEDENTPLMDVYIFYTLAANAGKEWGKASFKDKLEGTK
jgi:hypothetical protein